MAQLWHLKAKSHKKPCIITAGNDNSVGFHPFLYYTDVFALLLI